MRRMSCLRSEAKINKGIVESWDGEPTEAKTRPREEVVSQRVRMHRRACITENFSEHELYSVELTRECLDLSQCAHQ